MNEDQQGALQQEPEAPKRRTRRPVKSNVLTDNELAELIPDKVKHKIGSIKIIKIDNITDSKVKWNGLKWVSVCRHPTCVNDVTKNGNVCSTHFEMQSKILKNKIVNRGEERFKWSGTKWDLLCSNFLCENIAIKKTGKCVQHNINELNPVSTLEIFNQVKDSLEIHKKEIVKKK